MSTHGRHIVDALGTVGAPILMFDKRGFVVWTNMATQWLFADESGELTEQSFERFVAPECRSAMGDALVGLMRGHNETTELSIAAKGLDGQRIDLDLRAATVRVDGCVAGVIAVVADAAPSWAARSRRRLIALQPIEPPNANSASRAGIRCHDGHGRSR